jgi:hypothetical protein
MSLRRPMVANPPRKTRLLPVETYLRREDSKMRAAVVTGDKYLLLQISASNGVKIGIFRKRWKQDHV